MYIIDVFPHATAWLDSRLRAGTKADSLNEDVVCDVLRLQLRLLHRRSQVGCSHHCHLATTYDAVMRHSRRIARVGKL
jgi:hypothetical protein